MHHYFNFIFDFMHLYSAACGIDLLQSGEALS